MKPGVTRRLTIKTNPALKSVETELNKDNNNQKEIPKNMNEIITKTLTSIDPCQGKNTVYYCYPELQWKKIYHDEHFISIFYQEPSIIHKDDRNFNSQSEYHRKKNLSKRKAKKTGEEFREKESDSIRSIRNQLTFAERTSQTSNPQIITREIETAKL